MTGGAGPGTQIVGMTGSNYWQFAGTVSVGQVKGDSNLVSNSCFASGSNGGSSSDAKLQYQLKKVFADADSSQQLVVYRSVDQDGNLLRNSYGDVMYIVVDPRTCANAQQQQSISGNNWYNYRAERKSNGVDSSKGGSWRLHVFNAPQSNLQMTFPQYEGSFDVSDQARSGGTISDRVQAGNGSFSADSRVANEISYGVNTQQASYMDSEWVNDGTIFWKMTLNVDNWQNWSDGRLYVAADMPLQVIGAPRPRSAALAWKAGMRSPSNPTAAGKALRLVWAEAYFVRQAGTRCAMARLSRDLRTTATSALTSQMRATATEIQALGTRPSPWDSSLRLRGRLCEAMALMG